MTARHLPLPVRFALRELRGGLRGFGIFIACIALGVAAIAGVGSLARGLGEGLARDGQAILGGDLAFELVHREASAEELAFLEGLGRTSTVATMRVMSRKTDNSDQTLVEMKGVDDAYPLYGDIALEGGGSLEAALAQRDGRWGAVVEDSLLSRLRLDVGDRIEVGQLTLDIRGSVAREPDRLSSGIGFGPRLMIALPALRDAGLLQPGSLIDWHYRVRLAEPSDERTNAIVREARERFPSAGWDIDTRNEAAPGLSRNIQRFSQFLTLVGLTALIVGGVGVANAVRSYLDAKRDVIATLKCMGGTSGTVFAIYLMQIMLLAGIGIAIGLAAGALLPLAMPWLLADILPINIVPGLYARELVLALAYGALTALAFALWPLGRARDVPVSALFRERVEGVRTKPRLTIMLSVAAVTLLLAGLAIFLSDAQRIATIYVVAAAAAFVALRLVGYGIMWLARRAPRSRRTELRLAMANIHRPGALTPSVVLSLGLGLTLLVALAVIDGNLRRQLANDLPSEAPSFFFIDVQNSDREAFMALLAEQAPAARVDSVPMLRGRVLSLRGIQADEYPAPAEARWVLSGDRGVTYAEDVPEGSHVVEGRWWDPDYDGPPLVSFDADLARELGLALGDPVTVNVLGRNIEATIGNLRTVDWESLGINFVMIFSPNTFRGAPHTVLATVTYPDGGTSAEEVALLRAVGDGFPAVTSVRVKEALEAVNALVAQLAWAVRGASSVTLVASVLVLAGALAAGHRHRLYDAVILKTLGATRGRLLAAFGLEYLLLGLATAVFGVGAGLMAAYVIVSEIMELRFTLEVSAALTAALVALLLTVTLGLFGTWRILGRKPAPVLRNL